LDDIAAESGLKRFEELAFVHVKQDAALTGVQAQKILDYIHSMHRVCGPSWSTNLPMRYSTIAKKVQRRMKELGLKMDEDSSTAILRMKHTKLTFAPGHPVYDMTGGEIIEIEFPMIPFSEVVKRYQTLGIDKVHFDEVDGVLRQPGGGYKNR
jgi:hypothetical protein